MQRDEMAEVNTKDTSKGADLGNDEPAVLPAAAEDTYGYCPDHGVYLGQNCPHCHGS